MPLCLFQQRLLEITLLFEIYCKDMQLYDEVASACWPAMSFFSLSFWSVKAKVGFEGSKSEGSVPSSQLRTMFAPTLPILKDGKILRRSRRRSRSLFFGNMPETACRMIW